MFTDPTGLVIHHPYPLHLGGSNQQTGIDLPHANHQAVHDYFKDRKYVYGPKGRERWAKLPLDKQRRLIRGSLKAAGVKPSDIRRLMKDAFRGACPGKHMPRGIGKYSFIKNAIKGAAINAIILYPYEVYADTAPGIQALGEGVVLSQSLQWLIGGSAKPDEFPSQFTYHYNGEDYVVQIVNRWKTPGQPILGTQEYIIAHTIREGEIYWAIPDNRSCPLIR